MVCHRGSRFGCRALLLGPLRLYAIDATALRCDNPRQVLQASGGGCAGRGVTSSGYSFGLTSKRCGCFNLCRNCRFVCRYNGTDRAGLDPKARYWHGSPSDVHDIAVSAVPTTWWT
jgi:hypothetical protein